MTRASIASHRTAAQSAHFPPPPSQEDSVIVNLSAVQRGLFASSQYRTMREQNGKNHSTGEEEVFCRPDPVTTRGMRAHNYSLLGPDGFVPENTYVQGGDVVIGKVMPQRVNGSVTNHDTSASLKSNDRGYIDRNFYGNRHFTNTTSDGYEFAKVGAVKIAASCCFILLPSFTAITQGMACPPRRCGCVRSASRRSATSSARGTGRRGRSA